jgi:putative ABC transport system permease protein
MVHGIFVIGTGQATPAAPPIELSAWQLSVAVSLIVISAAISAVLRLGLGQRLLLAAVRTTVQLLLIGYVLNWLFAPGRAWYFVLAMMSAMTLIAGISAVQRNDRRYRGIWVDSIISMWATSWLMASIALFGIVQIQAAGEHPSWYNPRYAIPLLGMILGNTISAVSLSLDRISHELASKRDHVETLLALGATRWESGCWAVQQSVRVGMVPTINTMMVAGVVSLPGMMTGQIIAGQDPAQAASYQIMIMFLIAAGTSLGTFSIVLLAYRRLFTADHQFQPGRLWKAG